MQHTPRFVASALLLVLVLLLLAACTPGTAQQPTPQPPTPTITLTTVTEPDAPDPTPPPAPTQPVEWAQAAALVGPEWTVAYEGDLNGDGVRDVVAYKAADITPASVMNSYLAEMPLTIAEAVIVQEAAPGSSDPTRAGVGFAARCCCR